MKTVRTLAELRAVLGGWRAVGETVTLVPTMGNLHAGHLSLVALARAAGSRTVVSVFVNPTQFGPGEDYASYPRTPDEDARLLAAAGVDLLFLPAVAEVYPAWPDQGTVVTVPELGAILCGASRPGHFAGVTSVVARLFNLIRPETAVFGQKDYQQLVILRRMVSDLHYPVRLLMGPTCREADGLAMSSRNHYLEPADRGRAPALHRALNACVTAIRAGNADYAALEAAGLTALALAGFRPDYFAIRRADNLAAPAPGTREGLVVLAAGHLGRARLIDNILV